MFTRRKRDTGPAILQKKSLLSKYISVSCCFLCRLVTTTVEHLFWILLSEVSSLDQDVTQSQGLPPPPLPWSLAHCLVLAQLCLHLFVFNVKRRLSVKRSDAMMTRHGKAGSSNQTKFSVRTDEAWSGLDRRLEKAQGTSAFKYPNNCQTQATVTHFAVPGWFCPSRRSTRHRARSAVDRQWYLERTCHTYRRWHPPHTDICRCAGHTALTSIPAYCSRKLQTTKQ